MRVCWAVEQRFIKIMLYEIDRFICELNEINGLYLDTVVSYTERYKMIVGQQIQIARSINKTIEELDKIPFAYAKTIEDRNNDNWSYVCTQGYLKKKLCENGIHHNLMGRLCLVLIYEYWESVRRVLEKNLQTKVSFDLMGDLRYIRQSIIHNISIAVKDIEKSKILKWHHYGNPIIINSDRFDQIIIRTKRDVLILNLIIILKNHRGKI